MVSLLISLIGSAGSIILAIAFLPQCYRVLNTKHTKDISLYYLLTMVTGSLCFVVYGYGIHDPIVFILNMYSGTANTELVLLKLYYDRKTDALQASAEKQPA